MKIEDSESWYNFVEEVIGRRSAMVHPGKLASKIIEQRCDKLDKQEQYHLATLELQIICWLNPQDPDAYYRWVRLLLATNETTEALEKPVISDFLINNSPADNHNLLIHANIKTTQFKRVDPFEVLPTELINRIFLPLGLWERTKLRHVSKLWYQYLISDSTFWNSFNISTSYKSNIPIAPIIDKFLQNASRANVSEGLSIKVGVAHTKYETQPLRSLMKGNFAKQHFTNIHVDNLTIGINLPSDCLHQRLFQEFISVKFLEIRIRSWTSDKSCPINLEFILIGQRKLETLIFDISCSVSMPICNMTKGVQCFSLKKVNIKTCDDLTLITINCIIACPNLEDLDLQSDCREHNRILNIDKLNKRVTESKLKSFSLYGGLSTLANNFSESNELFPNCLESLSLISPPWSYIHVSQENLENLQTLILGRYVNASKLLQRLNLGKNLQQLYICTSLNGKLSLDPILYQYSNLKVLRLCGKGGNFDDRITNFILNHFPKLERLYLHHDEWDWKALDRLLQRRGLRIIACLPLDHLRSQFVSRGIICKHSCISCNVSDTHDSLHDLRDDDSNSL